jgi:hypothetical protein
LKLLKEDPEISIKLLGVMAQRLMHLASVIENLSLKVDGVNTPYLLCFSKTNNGAFIPSCDVKSA